MTSTSVWTEQFQSPLAEYFYAMRVIQVQLHHQFESNPYKSQ